MKDVEIIGMIRTYIEKTLVGMGALKGAPCQVQGTVDEGDGTQILTLKWEDTAGVTHTTDITLPAALFEVLNPTNGQTLRYNGVSGKFENSNVSFSADLEDLDNVVITSVQNGQVLTYDAANNRWINKDGSSVAALSDLTDVIITTAQDGQFLTYDAANSKWINTTLAIDAGDVNYNNSDSGLEATKVQGAIDELASEKVDKVSGKGLSANDFTDAFKNKLDGIEDNAEVNDINVVKVNGTALTPDANKAVNIEEKISKLSDVDLTDLEDGMILIYDAATNMWYAGANTGANYTAGEGIEIDQNNVISSKIVLFTGTEAQWNALPLADQIKFTHYATTDDQTGQIDPVPTQNSNNLMTSGGIYTALQGKANASDLGTAAAKDSTNAVTQNDTALVESGAVYTALENKADKVSGATNGNFAGLDANGNLTDSGKKASDFATAANLANYINENGAINQFDITLSNTKSVNTGGTWDGNAFTYRGLTYTVNADADNIVITGTPTDNSFFYLLAKNIPSGIYTFGGLKDSANIIWDGGFWLYNGNVETAISTGAAGNKNDFTVDLSSYTFDRIKFGIKRKSNTLTNDTVRLFIRKADINIDVNAPYAKTNRELTEELTVSKGAPTENTDYIASSDLHYEKYGKVVHVFGNFETNTAILGTDALVTLFTNLPNSNGGMNGTSSQYTLCLLHDNTNDGLSYRCFVSNEGKLVSRYKAIPVGTYFADFTYICQ